MLYSIQAIDKNFYHAFTASNDQLPMKGKEIVQAETALAFDRLISDSKKTVYYKGQRTKIDKVSELP